MKRSSSLTNEELYQGELIVSCSVADVAEPEVAVRRLAAEFKGDVPTPFILGGSARMGDELVLVLRVSNFILTLNQALAERRIQLCRFKILEGSCSFGSR
jgi:hypothetical protein